MVTLPEFSDFEMCFEGTLTILFYNVKIMLSVFFVIFDSY